MSHRQKKGKPELNHTHTHTHTHTNTHMLYLPEAPNSNINRYSVRT
jgi:hypothetical protein